jgi:hypothetical protein
VTSASGNSLASGVTATAALNGGAAAYFRFAIGAGQTAWIAWGSLPPNVQVTVVRTH